LQEITVKVIPVNIDLRFLRHLFKYSSVMWILEGIVLVHGPLVLEKGLDSSLDSQVNLLIVIEFLENTEEACK
jgi:hypothetical protein